MATSPIAFRFEVTVRPVSDVDRRSPLARSSAGTTVRPALPDPAAGVVAGVDDSPAAEGVPAEHPVAALTRASMDAQLLVVGSRSRGAWSGLLLGSVSQNVLHHAECTVAVVHGPTT